MSSDSPATLARRLEHLEQQLRTLQEHAAFVEHADEAMKRQLVEVDRAVRALAQRVIGIEARLAGVVAPRDDIADRDEGSDEAPP